MNSIDPKIAKALESLNLFRSDIYQSFPFRADAAMDLLDALTSQVSVNSIIELSLNPLFRRLYGSVHDAIHSQAQGSDEIHNLQQIWWRIIGKCIQSPIKRNFYLIGTDVTDCPRPYAETLEDRTINYHPNPAPGNKPIQVGHAYSLVAALPEKDDTKTPPWIIPLTISRVPSDKKAIQIAVAQMDDLWDDASLPFKDNLTALTADSAYGTAKFLHPMDKHENLVVIARVRGNRKFYLQVQNTNADNASSGPGHPTWHGEKFQLQTPDTWGVPNHGESVPFKFKNGREAVASILSWDNLVMNGKHDIPMHQHPFTLVRITINDAEGNLVFKRPLWLIAVGKRRHEISLADVYAAYRQRYDLEHFFRFGKQKLLLTAYQTAEVRYEENWLAFVLLAYVQLYLMSPLAGVCPRPWERYLPQNKNKEDREKTSPSQTKRDATRILRIIGTPASDPKRRGTAPGRIQGIKLSKRERRPFIKKGKATKSKPPS